MLPQGMFSVAIATVLFPALSRFAARRDYDGLRSLLANGMRQVFLLLIPAAAATLALSEPITRLIYEHGRFGQSSTDLVSSALFWFAFSLPFSGVNLLLTRTFFSLQKPWITTGIAGLNLTVNVAVSVALYKPFGIAGIVIGTGVVERGDDASRRCTSCAASCTAASTGGARSRSSSRSPSPPRCWPASPTARGTSSTRRSAWT